MLDGISQSGRVPVRGCIHYGRRDANNPAGQWKGYVPFDGLPHAFDPPRGCVAGANQCIAPSDYPHPFCNA